MDFADNVRLETAVVTIVATGVPQRLSETAIKVKFLCAERINAVGDALFGDANHQVLSGLTLNGNNQWIDLSSIYVKGTTGDQVGLAYSRTFK